MNARELVEFIQKCIQEGQVEKAMEQYNELPPDFSHSSESLTLFFLFLIYRHEKEQQEPSFLEGCATVSELMDRYNQLKFYLRRYDFDVHYDTGEFVEFIKNNRISSSAIVCVAQTSTVNLIKVLNEAAMTLFENEEYLISMRILTATYRSSQDDVTLFNLSQVLLCLENYEMAQKIVEQIKTETPQVKELKSIIWEKLS